MADTNFVDTSQSQSGTPIVSSWLNDVNRIVYKVLNNPVDLTTVQGTLGITGNTNNITSLQNTYVNKNNNLSDLANAATARTNLGLQSGATTTVGTAATQNVGTAANNVVQLDANAKLPAVDASQLLGINHKNVIINGNFDIWQRGTSFTANGYTADRWLLTLGSGAAATVSQVATTPGQTSIPNNPKYDAEVNITTAGTTATTFEQRIESVLTFAGQTATISFWANASVAETVGINLIQNFGSGGAPSATVTTAAGNLNLAIGWAKYTLTVNVPSISGKTLGTSGGDYLSLQFSLPAAVAAYYFSEIQIELGIIATPFEQRPIGQELAQCQRYFRVLGAQHVSVYGLAAATNQMLMPINPMRAAPTVSLGNASTVSNASNITLYVAADGSAYWQWTSPSTGQSYWVVDSVTLNAEL